MKILIVDDSNSGRLLLNTILKKGGYEDVALAESAMEAFEKLGMEGSKGSSVNFDLILMDVVMPDVDGIEATRKIKATESLKDIPVVMVTASDEMKILQSAFDAGAIDYITKPYNRVELLARVSSVLKLKHEMDSRKERERELLEVTKKLEDANERLEHLSSMDGLTGIANRRQFDIVLDNEWRRAQRESKPLSLIFVDIDFFKKYNDRYGHQKGDDCLKSVASALNEMMKRPGDLVARYGGEEFVIILPDTSSGHAAEHAEKTREAVESLAVAHESSENHEYVTVSMGVATVIPEDGLSFGNLIEAADKALYRAKNEGRNRVELSTDFQK